MLEIQSSLLYHEDLKWNKEHQSIDVTTDTDVKILTQMLKLSDKAVKMAIIKMLHQIIMSVLKENEKIET
jgi:hypothetical protein